MIFIILLIYFILLIIIEFFFICSTSNKKESITIENIEKIDTKKHKLQKEKSEKDIDIKNFVGKFVLLNQYGFYINLDNWNLLQPNKLYEFKVPVNIKIIKIKNNEDIEYLLN
jgi:sugar phosphate permease